MVAIIPARGGSKRVPRKNIRHFHGKPIISYSIEAAHASELFDKVIVSTDDDEIESIARKAGALTFRRMMDDGTQGTQEVAAKVLRHSDADYACVIYPCAPMLTVDDLRLGHDVMKSCGESVHYVYIPGWFYFGRSHLFATLPNVTPRESVCLTPDEKRWVDVNTEYDWLRADLMYSELHKVTA